MLRHRVHAARYVLLALLVASAAVDAQTTLKVTTPKDQWGHNIGDDYFLVSYTQWSEYLQKLDKESDRLKVVEIGKTAEDRPMYMGIITSPENQKKLDRYKEISRKLALAEGLTDDQAKALAAEGKAVVWIDGGLHATEVLGAQQLIETTYQLVSRTDPETTRILNDCIVLTTLVNPDGMELVSNWYMRNPEPTKRSTGGIPRLYQKYIGHDDNRDFYISNQPETEAINKVFFLDWYPQIIYNHHQTGPAGAVMFAPPFRDPFNYNFDPLIPMGIDIVAASMHNRFELENKPGVVMRSGSSYSTWWNGGLRTIAYFHNMIGLLTETIGNPTPVQIPFVPDMALPRGDNPFPIGPKQDWKFRQSIDYSVTANYGVLDIASRRRDHFLYNIYKMGKNSIDRGNTDVWTLTPREIEGVKAQVAAARGTAGAPAGGGRGGGGGRGAGAATPQQWDALHDKSKRDPRGFIIPSDQPDFLTAIKFVNALYKTGVAIHRATAPFTVNGKSYPAGSFVVKSAQAFRPHVLDMFEPQDHPDDFAYPGGPPKPPYDSAGWTLAYQMGVQFDRVLDGFDGPFEKITALVKPAPGKVTETANAAGYVLDHRINDAFTATNRLLGANEDVYWMRNPVTANGRTYPAGAIYIPAKPTTKALLDKLAVDKGLSFDAVSARPAGDSLKLKKVRVGLWDQYGGSMPSGHIRWMFEKQYELPFEVVYPPTLDAGNLIAKYDVLVFPDGGIPQAGGGGRGGGGEFGGQQNPEDIPAEFRARLGRVSTDKTIPQLKKFLEDGGTIITIGSSTSLAAQLGLPVSNYLVEQAPGGPERPLPNEKFYVPGSILQVAVDNTNPLAYGLPDKVDVFFDTSPVFRLAPEAALKGIHPVAWYPSATTLRSGWAWGQNYLKDGTAIVDANVGKGKLFLLGPEVTFRAQPHGTFKFLFNGIYYGSAQRAAPAVTNDARR
jgi:zinc carboxypeptidase